MSKKFERVMNFNEIKKAIEEIIEKEDIIFVKAIQRARRKRLQYEESVSERLRVCCDRSLVERRESQRKDIQQKHAVADKSQSQKEYRKRELN